MPYKDPEKQKEYMKEYNKKYYEKKNEYYKEHNKQYYENNKEQIVKYHKEYYESCVGKKSNIISKWRHRGLIETDQYTFDELYEAYLYHTNCEECGVELTTGKRCSTSKCLDHDHETGKFRNILCHTCNVKRR